MTRRHRSSVLRVLHSLLIITGLAALGTAWPALAGCLFVLRRLS
jgi:hypothetical protein